MANVVEFKKPKGSWQRKYYEHGFAAGRKEGYRVGRGVGQQDVLAKEVKKRSFFYEFVAFIAGVSVGTIGIVVLFSATL